MSARKKTDKEGKPSLADFVREKAKQKCAVCKLPKEIRAQLGSGAVKRGFTRADQAEWLRSACGASAVTLDTLNAHLNAHHDRDEDFNARD